MWYNKLKGVHMKKRLVELIYGFLFGISCLIPGFSGGTMLLILGIYESFTKSVAKLATKPLDAIKELIFYGIGAILGVAFATITVITCLNKYPLMTASFFVGLVIATIPLIWRNIRNQKIKLSSIVSFVFFAIIALIMAFGDQIGLPSIQLDVISVWKILYILILATLASATMIIPAASGMTILLVFGLYDSILNVLSEIFKGLIKWDFSPIINNLWILIPFIIGVIIGIIGISKAISKLLKEHDNIVWHGILALLLVSPITIYRDTYMKRILPMIENFQINIKLNIILSIITLMVGFAVLTYLKYLQNNRYKKQQLEEVIFNDEEKIA